MHEPMDVADTGGRTAVSDAAIVIATKVAAGAAIMAIESVSAMVRRADEGQQPEDADRAVPSRVAAAILAGVIGAERRAADAVQEARARIRPVVDSARSNPLLRPIERLLASGDDLVDRGRDESGEGIDQVLDAWDTVLDHIIRDVLRHVDVNELAGSIDVDAVAARVDVQRLVEKVDVNAVVERVDIDAIIRRVDLAGLTRRVLDEIDIGEVIRASTGSLTVETVDALRRRGADADRRLAGFVDRLLRRTDDRETALGNAETRVEIASQDHVGSDPS